MSEMVAERAWAVWYTPTNQIEMSEEYDAEALKMLNDHLAKGDFQVVSRDTQGFQGDLVLDFPLGSEEPYRALVMLKK